MHGSVEGVLGDWHSYSDVRLLSRDLPLASAPGTYVMER